MYYVLLFAICYLLVSPSTVSADYVMPYPSYMPGHRLYAIRLVSDRIAEWWNFGDIGRAKFHASLSDRYLIEAKTLFDYGQYKLAVSALKKSDKNFAQSLLYIRDVEETKKDNGERKKILQDEATKHTEILTELVSVLPEEIVWEEEKSEPITLSLALLVRQSQIMRSYATTQ